MTEEYDEQGNRLPHHKIRTNGPLQRPEFGTRPKNAEGNQRSPRYAQYIKMLPPMREFPGQWAKVAVFKIGSEALHAPITTKEETLRLVRVEKRYVKLMLRTEFPLEHWEVSSRKTLDTWGDRELWMRYIGIWTAEERDAHRAKAHHEMLWRIKLGQEKEANRQAAARAQVISMQRQRGQRQQG